MYEAFDNYLETDTWHVPHPYDDRWFYEALALVVRDPDFSPEEMGEHMRLRKGIAREGENPDFNRVINRRVTEAWAIKEFVRLGR